MEILVGCGRVRALIEALKPLDKFESSTAHSAAIMAFELVPLPSPLAGDASLHRGGGVVKLTILTVISMATTYRSDSSVVFLDMRGAETTMVNLLCHRTPSVALFLNLDTAHVFAEEIWKRGFKAACPWPPPERSRWDCRRRPLPIS